MKKQLRIVSALMAIALTLPGLVAQTSNTSRSTQGVFAADADNFMSVLDWQTLELKSTWLHLGLSNSSMLELGTAFNLGGAYLGLYYDGNMANQDSGSEVTNVESTLLLDPAYNVLGESVVTERGWSSLPSIQTDNSLDVLLGVAGMGIKLGFSEYSSQTNSRYAMITAPSLAAGGMIGMGSSSTSGYQDDSRTEIFNAAGVLTELYDVVEFTGGELLNQDLRPSLDWGMPIKLAGVILKPLLHFDADINTTSFATTRKDYDAALGSGQPTYDGVTEADYVRNQSYGYEAGYIGINGTASFGVELGDAKKSVVSFGVAYGLSTQIYQNTYNDLDGNSQQFAGVASWYEGTTYTYNASGTTTTVLSGFRTDAYNTMTHRINPTFKVQGKVGEKLQLGLDFQTNITIADSSATSSGRIRGVTTSDDFGTDPSLDSVQTTVREFTNQSWSSTSLYVSPRLAGALKVDLVPGTLGLNLGVSASLPQFVHSTSTSTQPGFDTVTTDTVYGDGTSDTTVVSSTLGSTRYESQTVVDYVNSFSLGVAGGFTLNLGEGFSLDLNMDSSGLSLDTTTLSLQLNYKN